MLRFRHEKGDVPRTDHFLTGIPLCRLQYWADITSEVTPEHGLVDKLLFVLSPSSYALWTVYEMAGPERSDTCNFLVRCFRTTLRRHCGQLLRQRLSVLVLTLWRRYLFFLCIEGFFLGSNKWIH